MKTDREFWYRIGQQMKATKEKRQANEREREHDRLIRQAINGPVNPAIAPRLRAALEEAKKNGN